MGCLGAVRREPGTPTVYTVYVGSEVRGGDVLDRLLEAAEDWARDLDGVRVRLEVHEDNARARAAYVRRGFVETGAWEPYPLDTSKRDPEMVRPLTP